MCSGSCRHFFSSIVSAIALLNVYVFTWPSERTAFITKLYISQGQREMCMRRGGGGGL
eukprot:SAG11_NODE_2397_length_3404_cov_1.824508_2_plen_58_part_00